MLNISIHSETIELQQFLKLAGAARSGGESKHFISAGLVEVNGQIEKRRGLKLRPGDQILLNGQRFTIIKENAANLPDAQRNDAGPSAHDPV